MITVSEEDKLLFEKNGFSQEDVAKTVQHYRELGISDEEIQNKINSQIANFSSQEKEVEQPTEQPQEEVVAEEKGNYWINPLTASYDDINEMTKKIAQDKLNARNEWETNHPIISRLQADYQPFYRSGRTALEQQAQYGNAVPAKELFKGIGIQAGQSLIPYANAGRDTILSILTRGKSGFVPSVLKNAGAAAIQSGTADALDELSNNGIGNVGKRAIQGTELGGAVGGGMAALLHTLPLVNKVGGWIGKKGVQAVTSLKPETIERIVQPDSIALDLTADEAEKLADATTQRLRDAYDTLKNQKGNVVAQEARNLNNLENRININDLLNDISDVYGKYDYGRVNTARNLEGGTENYLKRLLQNIGEDTQSISPYELLGLKRQIGEMTNWDIADAKTKNKLLEQIYGKFNSRLNELSPELAAANKDYAKLYDMLGERSRLRTILNPKTDIETATSKLKNYKGTNANIYDLENQLVDELGEQPFLNKIDDANAALDLAKEIPTGRNVLGIATFAKELAKLGAKGVRKVNQTGIPQQIKKIAPVLKEIIKPLGTKAAVTTLYGGVSNNSDNYTNYDTTQY